MTPQPSRTIERIGIDESGKGDYFGPLVIAAVFVDATTQGELRLMQVRDSKKISDGRILEMAPDIKTICPHSVIAIGPQKYNELYEKIRNLNRLLAWGHAKALETLLERVTCERAISDQFGNERLILNVLQEKGRKIVLEQRTKAESDLAVAAASILARAEFLLRLKATLQRSRHHPPQRRLPSRRARRQDGHQKTRTGTAWLSGKTAFQNDEGCADGTRLNRLPHFQIRFFRFTQGGRLFRDRLSLPIQHSPAVGADL